MMLYPSWQQWAVIIVRSLLHLTYPSTISVPGRPHLTTLVISPGDSGKGDLTDLSTVLMHSGCNVDRRPKRTFADKFRLGSPSPVVSLAYYLICSFLSSRLRYPFSVSLVDTNHIIYLYTYWHKCFMGSVVSPLTI